MILVSKYLVPKGYTGLTIFPFLFLKHKDLRHDKLLINHERIHLIQQLETLVLPFFLWYIIEFMIRLIQYRNIYLAYINISFERESYRNEMNLDYLKARKVWQFLNYL